MRPHLARPDEGWSISDLLWGTLLLWLGAAPMVVGVFRPRVRGSRYLPEPEAPLLDVVGRLSVWATLLMAGTIVAICLARPRLSRPNAALWLAALGFSAGPLISSRLGTAPVSNTALLLAPAVATAMYLLPPLSLQRFILLARVAVLGLAYGSLVAVLVVPRWALEFGYVGFVPGLSVRLHGMAGHANLLAPVLLSYWILEWVQPSRSPLRWLHWGAVLLGLVLVQSKTTWILAALLGLIQVGYFAVRLPTYLRYAAFVLLVAAALVGGAAMTTLGQLEDTRAVNSAQMESLRTLTGRTHIWRITLRLWGENPLFGYGPGLWSGQMRATYTRVLGWAVPHAHNQVLQTLGESGLVGLAGLLAYALVLLKRGISHMGATHGASLALILLLLLRGSTEVPLRSSAGPDANFFLHFLAFSVLIVLGTRAAEAPPPGGRAAPRGGRGVATGVAA